MSLVDVHCHVAPEDVAEVVGGLPDVDLGDGRITVGDDRFPFPPGLTSWAAASSRLEPGGWAVVSPPPALFMYRLEPDDAVAYARRLNDAMLEQVRAHERLRLLATLPLADPSAAAAEAERLADADALVVGVIVGTDPYPLDDPAMDPLWEVVGAHELGVFVHPNATFGTTCTTPRAGPAVGFPIATTISLVNLLLSDSSAWEHGTRFCFAHGGGFVVAALSRLRQAVEPELVQRVEERLGRVWVDGVLFDEEWAALVLSEFPAERVLPGSDWPFPLSVADDDVGWPAPGPTDELARRVAAWCPRSKFDD